MLGDKIIYGKQGKRDSRYSETRYSVVGTRRGPGQKQPKLYVYLELKLKTEQNAMFPYHTCSKTQKATCRPSFVRTRPFVRIETSGPGKKPSQCSGQRPQYAGFGKGSSIGSGLATSLSMIFCVGFNVSSDEPTSSSGKPFCPNWGAEKLFSADS